MKKNIYIAHAIALSIFIATTMPSCKKNRQGDFVQINAATEIGRLQAENEKLIRENENLKSTTITESKLRGKIEYNYTIKEHELTKSYITVFMDLFPTSNRLEQYRDYYDDILKDEAELEKEKQEQEIEEYQKAMTDYTGIWKIENFKDQNGNPTAKTYITTSEKLSGTYSDISFTAATFEPRFIISAKNNISLMIYEGEKSEPVSGSTKTPIKYTIKISDSNGGTFSFTAKNTSDRIPFGTTFSSKLHSALILGGNIKFELSTTRDSYPVKYEFQIPNAQFYNTACRLMGIL